MDGAVFIVYFASQMNSYLLATKRAGDVQRVADRGQTTMSGRRRRGRREGRKNLGSKTELPRDAKRC